MPPKAPLYRLTRAQLRYGRYLFDPEGVTLAPDGDPDGTDVFQGWVVAGLSDDADTPWGPRSWVETDSLERARAWAESFIAFHTPYRVASWAPDGAAQLVRSMHILAFHFASGAVVHTLPLTLRQAERILAAYASTEPSVVEADRGDGATRHVDLRHVEWIDHQQSDEELS